MSHIFWNKNEIPIPNDAHVNNHDGRVYIYTGVGKNKSSNRKVIGHATSKTKMHPNKAFKFLFPDLWMEYYGDNSILPEHVLHSGMFALTLITSYTSGLYKAVTDAYGPQSGNLIMDYSMYSVMSHSNVSLTFPERMAQKVTFSKTVVSDSYLSAFFEGTLMEDENEPIAMNETSNQKFRDLWMKQCINRGVTNVYLSIDGSNNDCEAEECELAEKGHAKSRTDSNIVSYIYVVNAFNGCPIVYFAYEGSKVDAKGVQRILTYLYGFHIKVDGIILDRGFCSHDVLKILKEFSFPYIILLKSNTAGYQRMLQKYGETIAWKAPYLVGRHGLFAITEHGKIFESHNDEAYIHFYFDVHNASSRIVTLLDKIWDVKEELELDLSKGIIPNVPKSMSRYFDVSQNKVIMNFDNMQKDMNIKGFSAIATSAEMSAETANKIYNLRDSSEKQYAIFKTQLGNDTTRTHYTRGILNKLQVAFIASCIRFEISNGCKKCKLPTNETISHLDHLTLMLLENDGYMAIHDETDKQKSLLRKFKINTSIFDNIAKTVNVRKNNSICSQIWENPYKNEQAASDADLCRVNPYKAPDPLKKEPMKKGRPKGSKNKKTLELEEAMAASGITKTENVKRNPGRPKGSKNKKTLQKEAEQLASGITMTEKDKRGRGRPKGSKNKKTLIQETLTQSKRSQNVKRNPGRPKGSKNRPKSVVVSKVHRKPGRPIGSKDSFQRSRRTKDEMNEGKLDL